MLVHFLAEGSDFIFRNNLLAFNLVIRTVCSFHNEFLHTIPLCMACCSCYSDIGAIHNTLALDIIRTLHSRNNLYDNDQFSVNFLHSNVRGNLRFATIKNGISNRIHLLKDFFFRKSRDSPCPVFYTKNQLAAFAIGKSHHCLHILFTFRWNFVFELHIIRFASKNLCCSHLITSSL